MAEVRCSKWLNAFYNLFIIIYDILCVFMHESHTKIAYLTRCNRGSPAQKLFQNVRWRQCELLKIFFHIQSAFFMFVASALERLER